MVETSAFLDLDRKLCSRCDFDDICDEVFSKNSDLGHSIVVSFVNPFSYSVVVSEEVMPLVDFWFSDGALLCFVSNIFRDRGSKLVRTSFDYSSVAAQVFSSCVESGLRVGVIGGDANDISMACQYISERHRGIEIVYQRHGYGLVESLDEVTVALAESNVDILILGLGTPLQEKIAARLRSSVSGAIFTCGGFISQTGSHGDYYSGLVKRFGLRWLQRAIFHRHVRGRLAKDYPCFVLKYFYERFVHLILANLR